LSGNKKIALISVSNKKNLLDISRFLIKNNFQIVSTGGTYNELKSEKIPVKAVSEITQFPEIMDGRVKTLHPNIHSGLLAREQDNKVLSDLKIDRISLLIVNFYPFEEIINKEDSSYEDAIENIDIGGPAMVRAAAKNYLNCCVLTSPEDYSEYIKNFKLDKKSQDIFNKKMSLKAFQVVAHYDMCIANYLDKIINNEKFPKFISLNKINDLRYGENPHQSATLYQELNTKRPGLINSKKIQGKDLSYNNIVDGDSALSCVLSFNDPTCVIVKHANPCGVASNENINQAYTNAYNTDPISAFGGVIAFNRKVDEYLMKEILNKQFVELIIAPSFSKKSIELSKMKENIRVIQYEIFENKNFKCEIKSINDGFLIQDEDYSNLDHSKNYKVVTKKIPTKKEFADLYFSWVVAKYVKSNAIVFSKNKTTFGIGAGQMSRIDSTLIAAIKAEKQNLNLQGAVMASDAFFPFSDNVKKASELGISCIIQPGGSKSDDEVIKTADELGISLVFTGIRHFRH